MQRKHVYNLLAMAAIIVALGTDCLSSAGLDVRPEMMVSVAQKAAQRFSRGVCRREQFAREHRTVTGVSKQSVWLRVETRAPAGGAAELMPSQVLNLPPPLA